MGIEVKRNGEERLCVLATKVHFFELEFLLLTKYLFDVCKHPFCTRVVTVWLLLPSVCCNILSATSSRGTSRGRNEMSSIDRSPRTVNDKMEQVRQKMFVDMHAAPHFSHYHLHCAHHYAHHYAQDLVEIHQVLLHTLWFPRQQVLGSAILSGIFKDNAIKNSYELIGCGL